MVEMNQVIEDAALLADSYVAYPYKGRARSPDRFRKRPGYHHERDALIRSWTTAPPTVRTAAYLMMRMDGRVAEPLISVDGEDIPIPRIDAAVAMEIVSRLHDWTGYMPNSADAVAKDAVRFLTEEGYKPPATTTENIVAAGHIASKPEAYKVSCKLADLSRSSNRSGLERGLLQALVDWTQRQAHGAMLPTDLRKYREDEKLTQLEAAARLGVTLRQYARYERGETPVPEKVKEAFDILRPASGNPEHGPKKKPPPSPRVGRSSVRRRPRADEYVGGSRTE